MHRLYWIIPVFMAGFLSACALKFEPQANAQLPPARWEHKFFDFGSGGASAQGLNQELEEINSGGWEYTGYTHPWVNKSALFKRVRK